MSYVIPIKNARYGLKHRQKASIWPLGHPGVDLLPAVPRTPQDVIAPKAGVKIRNVGGACQGFDFKDDDGKYHRFCHVQTKLKNGQKFTRGETVGRLWGKGFMVPPGALHLHWVVSLDLNFRKQIDPLTLPFTGKPLISRVNELFTSVWGRQPQAKESNYFQKRVQRGITTEKKLVEVMKFWHSMPRLKFILEMQKWGCF